jgi:8-oxo-dGTP pyrophosphatase MutT (NUDIX family)
MITGPRLTALHSRLARALAPPRERYRPLRVDGFAAGWLDDRRATRLASIRDVFVVTDDSIRFAEGLDDEARRSAAIDRVARELAAAGELTTWRDERYAVAPELGVPHSFLLERAAARYFGIRTNAAHVNGVVRDGDKVLMWIARRSATKSIDPGMLDNLVGGGIAAGRSVATTVVNEAREEAGIPEALASQALAAGTVHIWREQPDGLQRETIFVHDLWLPAGFTPANEDGEVVDYRLVALDEVGLLIAIGEGPDAVTADASLVILDFLIRHDRIDATSHMYEALAALRHPATATGG